MQGTELLQVTLVGVEADIQGLSGVRCADAINPLMFMAGRSLRGYAACGSKVVMMIAAGIG